MTAHTAFSTAATGSAGAVMNDASPRKISWRLLVVFAVATLGAFASFAMFRLALSWDVQAAESDFQNRAKNYLQTIDGELQAASTLMYTFRAFFEANDQPVSQAEFLRFSKDLHGRVVGLRDTGWAPRVRQDQRAAFERGARAGGKSDFQIRERGPAGKLVPAAQRADYYPIFYLDSGAVSLPVLGFDLTSEPVRKAAIERALESHRPAATPPIQLITIKRPRGGVMTFIDAEGGGARPASKVEARGLAFGVVDIDAMMENIIAEKARLAGIDVYVFDPAGAPGERQVYWRSALARASAAPTESAVLSGTHWQGVASLLDQQWAIVFTPSDRLEAAGWGWHTIMPLVVGLTMTAMVVAFLLVSLRRTVQLERLTVELHRNAEKITYMARHDTLTDLPNRALFKEKMDDAIAHARRGVPFTLLCLDLDHFKAVNDRLGHGAGDELLRQVTLRLQACVRDIDTVARLGGDEFAVILSGSASAEEAERIATRLVETVGADYELDGHSATIGLSVGIVLATTDGDAAETLLARADGALYAAKALGRGRFCFSAADDLAQPLSPAASASANHGATH